MIAHITHHQIKSPNQAFHMFGQKKKFHQLAKEYSGYRGVSTQWNYNQVTFMSLWKDTESLNTFLESRAVRREVTLRRAIGVEMRTIAMSAYNFIPWREVKVLVQRNAKPLSIGSVR